MSNLLQNFVGVDISKFFFDVALVQTTELKKIPHRQFQQTEEGYSEMKQWLEQQGVQMNEQTLFCMEYTGIYNYRLVNFLVAQKAQLWVEMAMRIKKSRGFERSSTDKTDAINIAQYAYRHQDKKRLWNPLNEHLARLKDLIAQRDRVVTCLAQLTTPINELKEAGCEAAAKQLAALQKTAIKSLENAQAKIETAIAQIIEQDRVLARKLSRAKSVRGIGIVTAVAFLVYTNGFTNFSSAKQLACYCGVVPFKKKKSGISVNSKPKVSAFANKKLKCLLQMCALSAIKHDNELKHYYERKVAEGKNKMSVLNAVRNKLVLRMFAVVRDDRNYVDNYTKQCA